MQLLYLLSAVTCVLAIPPNPNADTPSVTTDQGTFIGTTSLGVDTFKAIPFAQPPLGPLRLKPPQGLPPSTTVLRATGIPTACPQFYSQVGGDSRFGRVLAWILNLPIFQKIQVEGEDCLTVNIQRPANADPEAKLPVIAWLFGGGFELGATQIYDGSQIVRESVELGKPVIFVAINYRVGGFGFLAGKELQQDGSTNLGLRDQRMALEWIQDNINPFGGDPTKVVLWGQSAGSISAMDHTIINGGDHSYKSGKLFRGAIMSSGSVVPTLDVASPPAQAIYDAVVSKAQCSEAPDTLVCLRNLDYISLLKALNSVPAVFSYRSLALSYLPRPDPTDKFYAQSPELPILAGEAAKVPVIIGNQMNEGTLFSLSLSNVTDAEKLTGYMQTYFPEASREDVAGLVDTYPSYASPIEGTLALGEWYTGFRRNAALLGDIVFIMARRMYLDSVTKAGVKAWSYLADYYSSTPVLGTFHASDIALLFYNFPRGPGQRIRKYYISFANNLDPNAIPGQEEWPEWTASSPRLLEFGSRLFLVKYDTFRTPSYEYYRSHQKVFHV